MGIKLTMNWVIVLGVALIAATVIAQQKPELKTLKDKESYAMGVEMLRNLKRQGFDFDLNIVIRGMNDAEAGGKLALTDEEMLESLNISASLARVRKTSDGLIAGQDNKKGEEEFLARNKSQADVVTLPSGLQ